MSLLSEDLLASREIDVSCEHGRALGALGADLRKVERLRHKVQIPYVLVNTSLFLVPSRKNL